MSQRLFGGGEIHADLSPSAFLNVATAIDAWADEPEPASAPYQRGVGERRADALDDLCRASLDPDDTRWRATGSADGADDDPGWEDTDGEDTSDGWAPTDDLDEAIHADADGDPIDLTDPLQRLEAGRRRLRRAEACRRRREHGRPTRTSNGALLCRFHHPLLHEHGWTLSVHDGRWIATDRHGTTWPGVGTAAGPVPRGYLSTARTGQGVSARQRLQQRQHQRGLVRRRAVGRRQPQLG